MSRVKEGDLERGQISSVKHKFHNHISLISKNNI